MGEVGDLGDPVAVGLAGVPGSAQLHQQRCRALRPVRHQHLRQTAGASSLWTDIHTTMRFLSVKHIGLHLQLCRYTDKCLRLLIDNSSIYEHVQMRCIITSASGSDISMSSAPPERLKDVIEPPCRTAAARRRPAGGAGPPGRPGPRRSPRSRSAGCRGRAAARRPPAPRRARAQSTLPPGTPAQLHRARPTLTTCGCTDTLPDCHSLRSIARYSTIS